MADVVINRSAVSAVAAQVRTAATSVTWELPELGSGVLGDAGVADALAQVSEQRVARTDILQEAADAAAAFPTRAVAAFARLDGGLARSLQ
ncbi:hypothetical protein [Microbacterium aurum]